MKFKETRHFGREFAERQGAGKASYSRKKKAAHTRPVAPAAAAGKEGRCEWSEDDDGVWNGSCGIMWELSNEGDPQANGMNFCPRCGKNLAPPNATSAPAHPPRASADAEAQARAEGYREGWKAGMEEAANIVCLRCRENEPLDNLGHARITPSGEPFHVPCMAFGIRSAIIRARAGTGQKEGK